MLQQLNKLRHCTYLIHFHLVVVTKYRRKCITKPMLERLKQIFGDTLAKWECELVEFNGEPDYLHILMSVNPKAQPSKLVNNLKTVSSRLIRKEFAEHVNQVYRGKPVFWSRTYCLLSCAGAPLSIIKQYIEQQAEIE